LRRATLRVTVAWNDIDRRVSPPTDALSSDTTVPNTMDDFVHLHVHTQFSLLDGAIKIPELMERVNEHSGHSAVAMTDHGNMYGAVDFQKAAHDADVQPIIGCEMYMTDEADFREADSPESYHLTLLAKNLEGYYNLAYLNSMAWLQGYHEPSETPRISREFLAEHNEGLICLSGDLGSRLNQAILSEDLDEAREIALEYKEMFPEDHYYLEIMHNAFPEQETCTEALIEMSDELDIPLVATNNAHYLDPEDARAQAILMCIQLGKTVELEKLMDHGIEDFHLRSPEEMRDIFSHVPEACDNTLEIAEMCNAEIPLGDIYLPDCDVPEWFIEDRGLEDADQNILVHEYFEHSAREGLEERFEEFDEQGKEYDREEYIDRLEDEIGIIREMDYPGYFLIVADFIQWAKDQDIPVGPGRGSGAGSLVAYAMRITGLDPMPYDLLFERFLNPERVSMPDFDIDFCMNQRGDVIDYVTDKYGEKNVGQIITYGKMKAKGAVRDVGRTLNFSYDQIDHVADLIPDDADDLDDALDQEPKLQSLIDERDAVEAWIDIAQSVENVNRQCSIHAAGVVISDDPVWERVPVKRGDNGEMVTQYAMEQVEEAGLVKFDFLGLKTLTVIDTAAQLINEQRGPDEPEFDAEEDIPLDDPGMYELISSGDTTGVFQLESEGFQRILQRLKPEEFEEVVASVALYRPGPLGSGMVDDYIDRKHGRKEVEYPHPWLEEVLEPTYGVMVYQEQVMQVAQIMAGYSLGEADLLRRSMGKKKAKVMKKQRKRFVSGAVEKEVDEDKAEEIFDLMAQFASYGFNKSHSAAYAVLTCQTAYLKHHHPVEFMAALMTCDRDDSDKIVGFLNEAKDMGIEVLPPDVNESNVNFSVSNGKIRFGMAAIKGVGASVLESIIEAREEDGPYESLYDFCERVDLSKVNTSTIETLVESGAFDTIGPVDDPSYIGDIARSRASMHEAVDRAVERGEQQQHDEEVGQSNIFGMMSEDEREEVLEETYPEVDPWSERELLENERELLGFYVTGHPLDRYEEAIGLLEVTDLETITESSDIQNNQDVTVAGVIGEYSEQPLKSKEGRMAFVTLEDQTGRVEVLVFSRPFEQYEDALKSGQPLVIEGDVMIEGDGDAKTRKIRADDIYRIDHAQRDKVQHVCIDLSAEDVDADALEELKRVLVEHRGSCQTSLFVSVETPEGSGRATLPLPDDYRVEPSNDLLSAVDQIFGERIVELRQNRRR
jgi:DNA polymerase-3 subunit alpha